MTALKGIAELTMNTPKSAIADLIEAGRVLGGPLELGGEVDDALDERDSEVFETQWLRIHEKVLKRFSEEFGLPDYFKHERSRAIDKLAYLKTYDLHAHPELCANVAEDLCLIESAMMVGVEDPWLSAVLLSYLRNVFPTGELEPVDKPLAELIATTR